MMAESHGGLETYLGISADRGRGPVAHYQEGRLVSIQSDDIFFKALVLDVEPHDASGGPIRERW